MLSVKLRCLILFFFCMISMAAAEITPITPRMIELGQIKSGEVIHTEIQFINSGNTPLFIENVRTSCGCTAADLREKQIAVGDTAHIAITFRSKGFRGEVRKNVTVMLRDHNPGKLNFVLAVDIIDELEVIPRYLHYKLMAENFKGIIDGQFVIKNRSKQTIHFTKISTKDNSIQWKAAPDKIKSGQEVLFNFEITPKKKTGFSYEQVIIETDYENKPRLVIPVYVNIKKQ